jgi:hypothetical protein
MGRQGIVSGNGPAPGHSSPAAATLVLLAQRLSIRLAIGVKVLFAAFLPRGPHFRRRDVPIGPALFRDRTQVLTEIFHRRPAEEPIAVVYLVDDQARLQNDDMGIIGLLAGSVYSAMSRSFCTTRPASERNGQ